MRHRIVIVGAGFGGLRAAKSLARTGAEITVIDKSNHHLFQPLLYQVATGFLAPSDIAIPIRYELSGKNYEVLMGEVIGVDKEKKLVHIKDSRSVPYDTLILAAGAQYNYFGHEEWEFLSPGLKSVTDAGMIRSRLLDAFEKAEKEPDHGKKMAYLTFVMVGGGPTGVELAGSLAELARGRFIRDFHHVKKTEVRILVIEGSPRILSGFPEFLAEKAKQKLHRLGVEVLTNSRVTSVDSEGVKLGETRIAAKTVVWTAGVKGSSVGQWLQAPVDNAGRVSVEPDCTIQGHPEIFVIGDVADYSWNRDGTRGNRLPGVAEVALQQGLFVGRVIRRRLKGKKPPVRFHYIDLGNLAVVGRGFSVADIFGIRLWGFLGWVVWAIVHITFLIGFGHRLLVLAKWAWNYTTQKRSNLIITSTTYGMTEKKTGAGEEPQRPSEIKPIRIAR